VCIPAQIFAHSKFSTSYFLTTEEMNEQVNEHYFPVDLRMLFSALTLRYCDVLWPRGQWVDFAGMYWFTNV
jgi:hypothetical protein